MKQRTRITAVVLASLYSVISVFGSISILSGIQRTLQQAPELVAWELLGMLANAAIALGWIALLKNRAWVWPILVGLMALSSVAVLSFAVQIAFHSESFPWWMGLMPFAFGWVSIPALILLLTDKPSGWSRQQVTPASPAQGAGDLKKRTRLVAWIYLVISAMSFLSLPMMLWAFRHRHEAWLQGMPEALVWVLWMGLLGKRIWAWWALVAAYAALSVWYVWGIAHAPGYYATHQKVLAHPYYAMIPGAVMLILMVIVPLWALLTDRPSGWTKPEEARA